MSALPVVWMGGKVWFVDERLGEVRRCDNPHDRLSLLEFATVAAIANTGTWQVEDTGGGCQWLRRGRLAITDGDAGIPEPGEACALLTLDENGDYTDDVRQFASLEAALAHVRFLETHYGGRSA